MSLSPQPDLGSVLADRYRLDRLLGKGGMGAVYEGHDLRLQRAVAIKLILPHRVADADAVTRFLREARAAAGLTHPGIVTVHDVGQTVTSEGPMPFLVMEKLEGESLAVRLGRGPLAPERVRDVGVALLDALAVAHEAGIVHRDIKPDNVFLRAPDGRPTLLDFGVARVATGSHEATLTQEGQSVGTPLYMAPEQLRGTGAGPTADLYAVGALLYEAATGRPIYRAGAYSELVAKKLSEEPDLSVLLAAVGEGPVYDTIASALERDPHRRPATAKAMIGRFAGDPLPATTPEAFAETVSVDSESEVAQVVEPAPTPEVTRPSSGRQLLPVVLVALTLAGGATAFLVLRPEPEPPPAANTTPPLEEPTQALRIMAQYHDASGSERTLLSSPDLWAQCVADLDQALAQEGAPTRWRSGRQFCVGMKALGEARAEDATAALEEAVRLDPEWADPRVPLAQSLVAQGLDERAMSTAHEAARLAPDWWVAVSAIGSIHARMDRKDEAIQAYRRALALAPDEPRLIDSLALVYHSARMDTQARQQAERALALDPEAPWAHLIEAERALEEDRPADALESAEATLAVHPRSPAANLARGDALLALGRDDEARTSYEKVLELIGEEEATGLPEERLAQVREALGEGELPPSREDLARATVDSEAASMRGRSTVHRRGRGRSTVRRTSGGGMGRGRSTVNNDPLGGLDGL